MLQSWRGLSCVTCLIELQTVMIVGGSTSVICVVGLDLWSTSERDTTRMSVDRLTPIIELMHSSGKQVRAGARRNFNHSKERGSETGRVTG